MSILCSVQLYLAVANADAVVIAHRGASAYLPENTLAAGAMAYAMQADFLELDVVMSRDGVPVVFHDLTLDALTDVAALFTDRSRENGKHYVVDFSFVELSRLTVRERTNDAAQPRYPKRFPPEYALFRIPSLEQALQMVRGLNHSGSHEIGLYVELKGPQWHEKHNLDITSAVIDLLHRYQYSDFGDKVFIQCFDAETLKRIKRNNLTSVRLTQLIGENRWWPESRTDYDHLKTPAGLMEVSEYAAGRRVQPGQKLQRT
ncbi:MAG: glycerophosphodiester phosphodiesterase family protein [Pseudomonadota bacterium]